MNEELIARAVAYEMREIFDKYGALPYGPEHAFYHVDRSFDSLKAALKDKNASAAEQIDRLLHHAAVSARCALHLSPITTKGFVVCYLNRAESPNAVILRDDDGNAIVYPLKWIALMVAEGLRLDADVAGCDVSYWAASYP